MFNIRPDFCSIGSDSHGRAGVRDFARVRARCNRAGSVLVSVIIIIFLILGTASAGGSRLEAPLHATMRVPVAVGGRRGGLFVCGVRVRVLPLWWID